MSKEPAGFIEHFDHKYLDVFKIQPARDRWIAIRELFTKDDGSARVLFATEVLALIDTWKEPTPDQLLKLHEHQCHGGRIAFRLGSIFDLIQPVWVVEVAKFDVITYRAIVEKDYDKRYPLVGIKTYQSAVVQAWWAFETVINDLAGIIRNVRKDLDSGTIELLDEQRTRLDKDGTVKTEPYYQYLIERIQFVYRLMTSEGIDRGGSDWQNIMNLKNARDVFVHRLSKDKTEAERELLWSPEIVFKGFTSARKIVANIFLKTPEFQPKFTYQFLAFWSLDVEQPFVWDGIQGKNFYFGLGAVDADAVTRHFAPHPASFSVPDGELLKEVQAAMVPDKKNLA